MFIRAKERGNPSAKDTIDLNDGSNNINDGSNNINNGSNNIIDGSNNDGSNSIPIAALTHLFREKSMNYD